MKKNGFTLIELLAVIVILAIIALIATPIILGIVEDARKDSFMRSVELVINATDIDIFGKNYTDTYTYTITDGVVSNLEVGVKNTDGMNGSITYDTKGNDTYAIHNGKYCVIKTSSMNKAEIKDYVEGECVLSNATDASYFTYEQLYEYEIVDIDACVEYYVNDSWSESAATSICNDEPQVTYYGGMSLTEWLASFAYDEEFQEDVIEPLKEAGAIEEIVTSGIEITGYSEEGPKELIIPSMIDGKEVVSIGDLAFTDMSLTSVVLPETVVNIGYGAFSSNLLTDITLPNNLETLSDYAFCYNNLNETTINNLSKINEYAYCGATTDGSCFTYEDVIHYEIVDIDACFETLVDDGYNEDNATRMCNNEPDPYDGMTFIDELNTNNFGDYTVNLLVNSGAIEEVEDISEIRITGYECSATDVIIPKTINNKTVVQIKASALKRYNLVNLAIPKTVTYVGSIAFERNPLQRAFIENKYIHLSNTAFCGSSDSLTLKSGNKIWEINPDAFSCPAQ